jgi:hypothetical protein
MRTTFLKHNSKRLLALFVMPYHSMVVLPEFHQQKVLFDRDS